MRTRARAQARASSNTIFYAIGKQAIYLHVKQNGYQVNEEEEEYTCQSGVPVWLKVVDSKGHLEQVHPESGVIRQETAQLCRLLIGYRRCSSWPDVNTGLVYFLRHEVDKEDALREGVEKDQVDEAELAQIPDYHVSDHGHKRTSYAKSSTARDWISLD